MLGPLKSGVGSFNPDIGFSQAWDGHSDSKRPRPRLDPQVSDELSKAWNRPLDLISALSVFMCAAAGLKMDSPHFFVHEFGRLRK